jgi:hypothetical protein
MLGFAVASGTPAAEARRRRPDLSGPCGKLGRDNTCERDSDCCTGHCRKLKGKLKRCRCLKRGETCHQGQTCCGKLLCMDKVCSSPDMPETCLVCASGCAFSTIADAVAAAADGAVITIAAGTYPTPLLTFDKSITLRACNGEPGVILTQTDGDSYMLQDADLSPATREVVLSGLTFRGLGKTVPTGLLYGRGASNWTVTGCAFLDGALGWYGDGGSASFTNCTFTGNGTAVSALIDANDGDVTITGCTFNQNRIAIYLDVDDGPGTNAYSVTNTTITASDEQAIQLSGCVGAISGCTIPGNGASPTEAQSAISLYESTVTISGTTISDNTSKDYGGGIYLASGSLAFGPGVAVTRNTAPDGSGVAASSAATITGASSSVIFGNLVGANCEERVGVGPWTEVPTCTFT